MHWYLIYTKPRQEKTALQNLEQQGYQCYLPLLPKEKLRQGAVALSDEALFPRYLFINLAQDFMAKSWSPIRSTKGVSRLVRFGAEPARIDDALVDLLRAHEASVLAEPERLFNPGERVQLTEGPFAGIEGIYQMADARMPDSSTKSAGLRMIIGRGASPHWEIQPSMVVHWRKFPRVTI